ncbi:MAG: RNA methyltransferase [Bdellovibrionota bacterium]
MDLSIQEKHFFSKLSYFLPEEFKSYRGKLITELGQFLSVERMSKMENVVKKRSRHVLTVFENTQHAHNISAVIRSVDTFGFLDLFFVYSNPTIRFRAADNIDRGASQWLFPKRLSSIKACAEVLKQNNYKIAVVSLPDFSRTSQNYITQLPSFSCADFEKDEFHNFVQDEKIALIFGSELLGVSQEWNEFADMYVHVDMFGFTESLNVSVCAGIILHSLRQCFENHKKNILLTELETQLVFEHWIAKDYTNARQYIANRQPELLPWFEFVRGGKFFSVL